MDSATTEELLAKIATLKEALVESCAFAKSINIFELLQVPMRFLEDGRG